jgi:hypothetical protein
MKRGKWVDAGTWDRVANVRPAEEVAYWALVTDAVGSPRWLQFSDGFQALEGWGQSMLRCLEQSTPAVVSPWRTVVAGACAAGLRLHDVALSLNAISARSGIVLWAGPLTVSHVRTLAGVAARDAECEHVSVPERDALIPHAILDLADCERVAGV